jgi:hypothetical protein
MTINLKTFQVKVTGVGKISILYPVQCAGKNAHL